MEKEMKEISIDELESLLLKEKEIIVEFDGNKFHISDVTFEDIEKIKGTDDEKYSALLSVKKINDKPVSFEKLVAVAKKMDVIRLSKLMELINNAIMETTKEVDYIKKK